MPWRPVASSPPPMISPTGCGSWSAAKFSMPTISADGSTALNRRIQASRPEIRVWGHSDDVWAQQFVFSRRRDARLQLLHGLRSGQRRNADRLDQPDHLPRRPADSQLHHAENARSDLYGVAASAEPVNFRASIKTLARCRVLSRRAIGRLTRLSPLLSARRVSKPS